MAVTCPASRRYRQALGDSATVTVQEEMIRSAWTTDATHPALPSMVVYGTAVTEG